jgi:hypothetical protein
MAWKLKAGGHGGPPGGFAPSQNYDLVLRTIEQTDRIFHLSESTTVGMTNPYRHILRTPNEYSERNRRGTRATDEALHPARRARQTLEYFRDVAGEIQIHHCPGPFNFSAINNFGVAKSAGEFLLFLNNGTQVVRRDWIRAMTEQLNALKWARLARSYSSAMGEFIAASCSASGVRSGMPSG